MKGQESERILGLFLFGGKKMGKSCLEELNPIFTTARAVMEIPLGSWQTSMGKLTNEEVGKIKDAANRARIVASIELGKESPGLYQMFNEMISEVIEVGDKTGWDMSAKEGFQEKIDDLKVNMELLVADAACQCVCEKKFE